MFILNLYHATTIRITNPKNYQSLRKAMPKDAQTTAQLHSSHTLGKQCSKFSKPGFSSMWTMNFQMSKLVLERAKEPEIKLPISSGSSKKQESSRKNIYFCFAEYAKALTVWITTNCGKFLKRWEYQTTLPVSWEICIQAKKQQLEPDMGTKNWFQIGKEACQGCILSPCLFKGACQGCILSPCLFNLYAEYIMQNARLDEAQAGIKIAWRNINNLRYADDTTLMAESEEELKSLLMKVKEENEKVGLKLNIEKTKIVASSPITSWQIDGETM